jgi:hypothetical protein
LAAQAGYQEEVRMRGYAIIDGVPSDRIRFGKGVTPPAPTLPREGRGIACGSEQGIARTREMDSEVVS